MKENFGDFHWEDRGKSRLLWNIGCWLVGGSGCGVPSELEIPEINGFLASKSQRWLNPVGPMVATLDILFAHPTNNNTLSVCQYQHPHFHLSSDHFNFAIDYWLEVWSGASGEWQTLLGRWRSPEVLPSYYPLPCYLTSSGFPWLTLLSLSLLHSWPGSYFKPEKRSRKNRRGHMEAWI